MNFHFPYLLFECNILDGWLLKSMELTQAELWVDCAFGYWLAFTFDFKFSSLVSVLDLMLCRQTVQHSQQGRAELLA